VLDELQVAQLVKLGTAIELHYSAPQDIEWCRANHQLFIVQVRPIMVLPPEPLHWDSPGEGSGQAVTVDGSTGWV
jgi:phosphoenolpyruvate synthase/pyruvate phosphate dikinase